jgi:hypothetical protein
MEQDKDLVIAALVESNEILVEENGRLRNNNRVLRTVISALRDSLAKARESVAIAQQNDDIFKSFCQGDFDAPVSTQAQSGLLAGQSSVEPVV